MNRFKRELRKRGYMLENDYEYLPYNGLETVVADAEQAQMRRFYDCYGWYNVEFDRSMNPHDLEEANIVPAM